MKDVHTDLEIGGRLTLARRRRGLSQTAAARLLGMSQSKLAKLELGQARLSFSDAIDLATVYGVSLDAFVPVPARERLPKT